jgi:hypothetical protein
MCVKKNSTGDVVIGIFGDYCKRVYRGTTLSDLSHWVLTQYIRP